MVDRSTSSKSTLISMLCFFEFLLRRSVDIITDLRFKVERVHNYKYKIQLFLVIYSTIYSNWSDKNIVLFCLFKIQWRRSARLRLSMEKRRWIGL